MSNDHQIINEIKVDNKFFDFINSRSFFENDINCPVKI